MEDYVYPNVTMQEAHCLNHGEGNPRFADEEKRCHWCTFGKWKSQKRFPISIINTISEDVIDDDFEFIEENIIRDGVELADSGFQTGCECELAYNCLKNGCQCLEDIETGDTGVGDGESINAYHCVGARKACLRGKMLRSRLPIYECNSQCACPDQCPNKVVSRGREIPLQVFRTTNRGWGLQSTRDIKKGQFVGRYVGELITAEEASYRRAQSSISQKKDVYLFALDKFTDPNSGDERLRGEPYEIDGEYFAGPTRFINHSCEPNLRIFAVVRDLANKPFHDLCFFALKEIPRFTELTFDYVDGVKGEEKGMERIEEGMTRCLCGANNCRKWLW